MKEEKINADYAKRVKRCKALITQEIGRIETKRYITARAITTFF